MNGFFKSCFIVESILSVVCKSVRHFIWLLLVYSKWNITLKVNANFVICSGVFKFLDQIVVLKEEKCSSHSCNFVTFTLAILKKRL